MKKFVFRFDIDTHKCIRDGVPSLLALSKKYNVPFSFFLNIGRAVSVKDSLHAIFSRRNDGGHEQIEMMSAVKKLGIKEYLYAALMNPRVSNYKRQIRELLSSKCEVGIHGGRNHAVWQNHALEWSREKIEEEIDYAVNNIKRIQPDYKPKGFASPAWVHPEGLDEILREKGFLYSADFHQRGENPVSVRHNFYTAGVNLLGDRGGGCVLGTL